MPEIAKLMKQQPKVKDVESALLALEALGAIAVAHGELSMRALSALELYDRDARFRVVEEAKTLSEIMGTLR